MLEARELDAHELRLIAVHAHADPRTVEKALRGGALRSSVALRIHEAIRQLKRRGKLSLREGDAPHV